MTVDSFCNQSDLMRRASGALPGMLGSYSGCPAAGGAQFCVLFPTKAKWGDSRIVGFCLPTACSLRQIARHVRDDPFLNDTFAFTDIDSNINNNSGSYKAQLEQFIRCAPRDGPPAYISTGNIVAWTILGFIVLVVLAATLYDYYCRITRRSEPFEVMRMSNDGTASRVLRAHASFVPVYTECSPGAHRCPAPFAVESSLPLLEHNAVCEYSIADDTREMQMQDSVNGPFSAVSDLSPLSHHTHCCTDYHTDRSLEQGREKRPSKRREFYRSMHFGSIFRRRDEQNEETRNAFGARDALWSNKRVQQFFAEMPEAPDFRSIVNRAVLCLSLINSFRKFRYYPKSEANLNLFNSWRVIAWLWFMLFSTFWYMLQLPTIENVESRSSNILFALVEKESLASFANGTFLVIAGFLAIHRLHAADEASMISPSSRVLAAQRSWGEVLRLRVVWYIKYLVVRFLRVVPINFAIIALLPNALSTAGSGPFWQIFANSPALHANCKRNWWTHFLLINNILPLDKGERCFPWSYYVALEFQLVAFAPFIYFLGRCLHHRVFFLLLVAAMICSAALRYVELLVQGNDATDAFLDSHYARAEFSLRISTVNQYPHLMFIPFCAGAMLYYLYRGVRQRAEMLHMFGSDLFIVMHNIQGTVLPEDRACYFFLEHLRSQRVRIVIIWSGLALLVACVLSAWVIHLDGIDIRLSVGARIYEMLILFPWCTGLCLIAFPLLFGYGGMFRRILTHQLWCGASRLVLVAYLAGPVVIGFGNASSYEIATLQFLSFGVLWFGYSVATLLIAFVLHMLIERPFLHMTSRGKY